MTPAEAGPMRAGEPGEWRVAEAVETIARGEIVIVTDDESRENEGDLVMAAESVTPELIAFFLEHTSGVICVALPGERVDELALPPMIDRNEDPKGTAFTVSVDLASGVSTGISAADRAATIRALADPASTPVDFTRPGHVFPLRARAGGVLKRGGHTEATVDLARLAGLRPAGILCEIVTADKTGMARGPELARFAGEHGLPIVSIAEMIRHRSRSEEILTHISEARVPTSHGPFDCHVWRSALDGSEHLAFVCGEVATDEPVLTRVHSECLTGDVFGSDRCDCGAQLDDALDLIQSEGRGVVVYLRGHEGRGIGLGHKIAAYALQDEGLDTVDANIELGLPVDSREYGVGAHILRSLGVRRLRLITNNPAKYSGLSGYGLEIAERVARPSRRVDDNVAYLDCKVRRLGHLMSSAESTNA